MSTPPDTTPKRRSAAHPGTVTVLVAGLVITSSLAFGAQKIHSTNEGRLLRQRVREAAAVVSAALPNLQTPLASAALLAKVTGASPTSFRLLMGPLVAAGNPFDSASLWAVSSGTPRLEVSIGSKSELEAEPTATVDRFLLKALASKTAVINNLLSTPDRRLGFAYAAAGTGTSYVVYAEAAFPKNHRATVDKNSAFSDLDYALYVGKAASPEQLIASSTGGALPSGQRASATVPFADSDLLMVMTARTELDGNLLARLPWALALVGLFLTLGAALLVERLLRRRDHAEALALENDLLYKEQRSVAQTLQHSLLPDTLPRIGGLELASRYVAGVEGIDIGGDWYDVMRIDDDHVVFVVGDVSGRGLRAATTMAELRYAVRAYAAQGDGPEAILTKVGRLINVGRDGHFATALCGRIELSAHRLTLANAGHPAPLLVVDRDARFVTTDVGAPLGVPNSEAYTAVTLPIPPNATLLSYTDGLVERRDEGLDIGLERLRNASLDGAGSIEDVLTRVLHHTIPTGSADDTAILGIRWLM